MSIVRICLYSRFSRDVLNWNQCKYRRYIILADTLYIAQLAGAAEYTDCFSAEG